MHETILASCPHGILPPYILMCWIVCSTCHIHNHFASTSTCCHDFIHVGELVLFPFWLLTWSMRSAMGLIAMVIAFCPLYETRWIPLEIPIMGKTMYISTTILDSKWVAHYSRILTLVCSTPHSIWNLLYIIMLLFPNTSKRVELPSSWMVLNLIIEHVIYFQS